MDRRVMEPSEEIGSSKDQRGGSDREDPSFKGMEGEKPPRRIDAPDPEAPPGDGSQPDDNASKQHDNGLLKTSEPPSGSNNTPSAIHGPVDIDYTALDPEQVELVKLLDDRGAVEGLIDNSSGVDVKVMELTGIFHDERDKIIDYILTDCEQGKFRRKTLQEYDEKEGIIRRLVYWQHYDKGNKFVEFLLDVSVDSPEKSTNIMELAPLDEDDLSDEATAKLVEILAFKNTKTVKRGVIEGELSFTDFEFGQTAVTMVGTLKAEERVTEMKPEVDVRTSKSSKSARPSFNSGYTFKSDGKRDTKSAYTSLKGILNEVMDEFRQPGLIDERRKRHFVVEFMPRAPPLTREEDAMLERVGRLEKELHTKGKRVKGTLKEGIDKFLWREGDNVWAAFGVTVDKSAKGVLAEQFLLDTFARSERHFKNNGKLPRVIRNDFEGTRSMHYHYGVKVPAATNRLFENWFVWKEAKLDNGQTAYMLGFVPLGEYYGASFTNLSKDGFVVGVTRGIYIMAEVAPNICRVTRIQTVDLKFHGIHKTVMDNAIDYLAKNQLVEANRLQEKFRRNGKEVDAEVRGALVERMREGVELEEDQKEVFWELEELFGGEDEKGWGPLKSPYEGVKMQIKYKQQEKGKKTLGFGRAECVADCSAEEAAAWFFEYCSRERMVMSREEGAPARLEMRKGGKGRVNEKLFATVKKLRFPLQKREFVMRFVWQRGHLGGNMSVAFVPAEEKVDYGGNLGKLVRATTSGIFTAKNIEDQDGVHQCELTYTQFMDAGGHIPVNVVNKTIPRGLSAIAALRDSFNRDEEVDKAALASLANIIKNEDQDYTDEEKAAIRKGKEFYEKCKVDKNFDELKSPDERVKMKLVHAEGESLCTGVATTVVDASVERCAANEIVGLNSREEMKKAKMNEITTMKVVNVNPHTLYYITTRNLGIPGFVPRDGRSKVTWFKQQDGKVVIDVADTEELQEEFPVKVGNVLGKAHSVWVFEPLDPIGDVPQTSVTFTTKVELGGVFYSSIMNKIAPRFLGVLSTLRKKFDKSKEIATFKRQQIIAKFEEIAIEGVPGIESHFDEIDGAQEISSGLSGTTMIKAEKGMGWGKTSITVRASHKEVAAFFWDLKSQADYQLELQRVYNQTLVITVEQKGHLTVTKFCQADQMKTDIEMMTRQEGLGKAASKQSVIKHLGMATDAAYYFDNLLKSTEAGEQDGRRFGEQLMDKVKRRHFGYSKVEVVREFIVANRALREITEQHGFTRTMLYAVVMNKFKRRATNEGEDKSEEEARGWEIGSAMTAVILTTATAAHAVDEWAQQFTEVQEVMNEQVWLRPMLEEIVMKLFMKSTLGLKARVTVGAATSMLDLLTDVYVTHKFWRNKKYGYFKASLASLAVSIGLQMLGVWLQYRRLGMMSVVQECIPILLGYKPAVDAYRVATGAKQKVGAASDSMGEMTGMKVIEMFAEAIPGVIIQLMAIATSDKDVGNSAWLSVAVSAITTGFASATISYDWDTDPAKRESSQDFYGYIPAKASKRSVVFVSTLLFSAGMLLIRCTTIVLLGLMGGSWAFLYIGADLGLYLLVKTLRGDFWYWIPLGGNIEIVSSIILRVMVKIIVDFTSIVHFRHPYEVGGAYWLFGLMLTMGSLPVSIYIASPHVDGKAIDIASSIANYMILITTICFAAFFLNIENKYWHTFWSTQKSNEYSMAYFIEGKSDEIKIQSLAKSRHHWVSIEGEIKKWVESNWATWEEEQPEWFTDVMKASVPEEFIPAVGDARRRESVRRASVDAEAEGGLAGAYRASIRRASVGLVNGGALVSSHAVNDTIQDYAGLDPNQIGKLLSEQLLVALSFRKKGTTKEEAVRLFIGSNYVLRQAAEKYMFVTPMLGAVVKNKLCKLRKIEGKAVELGEKEGRGIGESLAMSLAVNTQPSAAVDEFILNFPALQDLDEEYEWFRPMLETISYRLLEEVPWGLKARVTVGAITSMADLLTDVYVTYMFWSDEKYGYFKASLASLALSIGIQMLVVWIQNSNLGMKKVLCEWFPILIGYKPAVDAYRVATGAKQEVGAAFDPMFEMSCMRVSEMFAEAIPGVIIQLMAISTSDKDVGTSAWLSVAVSAITTGFASATLSYDWDTDPAKREVAPAFYGYVPAKASKRTLVFVSMLLLTAGMLLIRCTTIVLLGLMGGSWAFLYIGADLGLYLLVKILIGDFWWWMPLGNKFEIVSSILARLIIKIITDFTCIVQFRHPNELGGAYWLFGLVLTIGSLPVSIHVASPYVDKRAIDIASTIVNYSILTTTMCFAVFFLTIERKYWHTFWSIQRGKDLTMAYFLEGESDAIKIEVFCNSRHHWVSIEGEIKKWVQSNWAKWEEEKPEWFTDVIKATVPVDFIPSDGDARRRESVRRASVDAEAEGGLAGTLRASIRRASVGGADGGDIIGVGGGKVKVSSVVPLEDVDWE